MSTSPTRSFGSGRRELASYRGTEVKSVGDGFLASRACAIAEAVRPLDSDVRCGLQTGEIEIREKASPSTSPRLSPRLPRQAKSSSRAEKDLVAGSGPHFSERESIRSGLQDAMELYAALS